MTNYLQPCNYAIIRFPNNLILNAKTQPNALHKGHQEKKNSDDSKQAVRIGPNDGDVWDERDELVADWVLLTFFMGVGQSVVLTKRDPGIQTYFKN